MLDQHLAGEALQRLLKPGRALLADTQLGPRANQRDLLGQRLQKAGGQLLAGLAVVADH